LFGNNVRMVIGGRLTVTGVGGGTSASGPIVAGLVALLNADRLDAGKPSLGLANPLFYQVAAANAGAFKPIGAGTGGGSNSNQCDSEPTYACCDRGLLEASGWDPLSGLGSMNYAALARRSLQVATAAAAAAEGERIVCPRLD
jgi:tripeptidyl-peptidase-1